MSIQDFLYKVEEEGLPYTVIDYANWEELEEKYPKLYSLMEEFRAAYSALENETSKLEKQIAP